MNDDVAAMNDIQVVAERRRVRNAIEEMKPEHVPCELTSRYEALDDEFIRRARTAWSTAS